LGLRPFPKGWGWGWKTFLILGRVGEARIKVARKFLGQWGVPTKDYSWGIRGIFGLAPSNLGNQKNSALSGWTGSGRFLSTKNPLVGVP